jgi:sulfide:quinone oxidoreductase
MKVLVLGAGFGGLELTSRLSDEFGAALEILLIDKAEGFIFGFSKLDVMFGRTSEAAVFHPYRDLVKPGVRFVQSTIRSLDPERRRVETDAGEFDGDVMVVALGADLDPAATPGLLEGCLRPSRGPRQLRRRSRRDRGDVHALQVPAGTERDGTACP